MIRLSNSSSYTSSQWGRKDESSHSSDSEFVSYCMASTWAHLTGLLWGVCVCAVPHSYSMQRGLRVHLFGKMKIWDILGEAESSSKYAQA